MDLRPIDAENHYYASLDAFTRHLDRAFTYRGVHAVQDGKRVQLRWCRPAGVSELPDGPSSSPARSG